MEEDWSPLSMSKALALGMDEASAKLAVQLQQEDVENFARPALTKPLPPCNKIEEDGAQSCIVCLVENVNVRLACGHAVLCDDCSCSIRNMESGITKCPLCRKYGNIVDSGIHLNLQSSYVDPTSMVTCDGCEV